MSRHSNISISINNSCNQVRTTRGCILGVVGECGSDGGDDDDDDDEDEDDDVVDRHHA